MIDGAWSVSVPPSWRRPGDRTRTLLQVLHDGYIKGTAAKVEDHDLLVLSLVVQAIRECRGGGLVDDPDDLQAGDGAGILGRLTLVVVEVRRNCDDRLIDGLAQERLGVPLYLLQDEGGYLLRSVVLPIDVELVVGAHLAFGSRDGAFRFVMAWRLAGSPTSSSPSLVNATYDGNDFPPTLVPPR